jgi:hypothetical protein
MRPKGNDRRERRPEPTGPPGGGVGGGLKRLVAPMLAGAVIDAVDFVTFGPIGLTVGFVLGGAFGYWLAPELGFPERRRWVAAALSGAYCTLPMTGFLPLATMVAGVVRALEPSGEGIGEGAREGEVIEVDFRRKPDDDDERRPR